MAKAVPRHSARRERPVADPWLARAIEDLHAYVKRGGVETSSLLGTGAVARLEGLVAAHASVAHALALPSGSVALRLALKSIGVGPGDEVVVPAYDWTAAVACVLDLGAVPVAADVTLPECTIDPTEVDALLSQETKAVIVTHLMGVPADVHGVIARCARWGVPVIEDCAQALGATVGDRPVGSMATAGVFSFGPGKVVDAGEGGMLVTNSTEVWRRAVEMSQHPARQFVNGISEPNEWAWGTRVHPLAAVLGVEGLKRFEATRARMRARIQYLSSELSLLGVTLPSRTAVEGAAGRGIPVLGWSQATEMRTGAVIEVLPLGGRALSAWARRPVPRAVEAAHSVRWVGYRT